MIEPTQAAQAATSNDSQQNEPSESGDASSPSKLSALEQQVKELQEQLQEKENRYKYLYADFDNFKKRAIKERSDSIKFGWENVARGLILVLDNLERAVAHMPASTDKAFSEGIRMVVNQFRATLEKEGVQSMETAEQPFDPNMHEAVAQESSHHPEGTIVQEHERGYTLHGRLLRPARVVVSGGK